MADDNQDHKQQVFQISFAEIDKILTLLEKLTSAVNQAVKLPQNERENLRKALEETAEIVVSILTTIKQTISIIIIGIRKKDSNIKTQIIALEYHYEWEELYRKFHLCEALRTASHELKNSFFTKLKSYFSFSNPEDLKKTIEQFMDNEFVVGNFVSRLLKDLAKLYEKLDNQPDFVLKQFENARNDIENYRDKFIEIEKQIRTNI